MVSEDANKKNAGSAGYREPSDVLKRLFLPSKTPSLTLSSDSRWLISTEEPPLPSIELLSKPEEKLGGLRFDPVLLAPSRLDYSFDMRAQHLSLQTATTAATTTTTSQPPKAQGIPLPSDSEGIRYIRFNPNPPEYALQQFVFASKRNNENLLEVHVCNLVKNEKDNDGESKSRWEVHSVPALTGKRLNFVNGCAYQFTSDGTSLLCKVVPEDHPSEPPPEPIVPIGPSIQIVTEGARKAPGRTYQDLLKNRHDEDKFRYYLTTELIKVDLTTKSYTSAFLVAQSKGGFIPLSMESSPCGRYLLVKSITELSYSVPLRSFGKDVLVWDLQASMGGTDGENNILLVASNPVDDEVPLSFDACSRHKRRFQFHPCLAHTLIYAHALDGGDPANDPVVLTDSDDCEDGSFRYVIYTQDIIESKDQEVAKLNSNLLLQQPRELCRLEWRYDDIDFTESGTILIDEYRWSDRMERKWKLISSASDTSKSAKTLVWERSWEDRYSSPGAPVRKRGKNGKHFVREPTPGTIFLKGAGASPLGDRPFLDRMDLKTGTKERLWRCKAPKDGELLKPDKSDASSPSEVGSRMPNPDEREDVYETLVVIMEDDDSILISRESKTTPRNYYLTSLSGLSSGENTVTAFPHPQPDLIGVQKELVQYKRKDDVELTANLYLPADYDGTPRPTLFWAYPREFKSSQAAGQIKGSKHRFVSAHWASPIHWAAKGWVVMDDFSLPVIGEGDAQPNDTFLDQIVSGATAAVEYASNRGVCDPTKCAVGGHSYGSFMTAHLLSHTSLFAAGIGRSGAFNRTLTPMSFQSEDRSMWEAQDTYITMSPLMHVKKYSEQDRVGKLLLIHGEVDENSGTHPLQSERYFAALKAFGIESRLCVLPHECHSYRARESILHMAWEQEEWLRGLE
uniref:Peptidase S9 prolyl oligopeptidase catalytic domain-containing protein n=1 Tax=Pseudo-nitzschia australis TaxID=44445 RepID=A0A7S4ENG5_9STRA